jgi:hypothetical protein
MAFLAAALPFALCVLPFALFVASGRGYTPLQH